MAKLWFCCALVLAAPVALAAADLSVVSFTADKTVAQYAEPITLSARIANLGPDAATNFGVHLVIGVGYPMSVSAPAGWTCSPLFLWTGSVICTTPSFAPGTQADFQTRVLVYSKSVDPLEATVVSHGDPVASNNRRTLTVTRVPSDTRSDLAVTATPAHVAAPAGETAAVRATVTNNGPSSVSNVHLIAFADSMREGAEVTGTGEGWTCTSFAAHVECSRASLPAGATSSVDLSFRSDLTRIAEFDVRVIAEKNDDPIAENSRAPARIGFGNATDYRMFLLPLDGEVTPGANGSVWVTDITMLLRSDTNVDVRPELCDLPIIDCGFPAPPPPHRLNVPFDFPVRWGETLGQYLYVPREDAHKVHVNIRTYDASRSDATGGAEIPVVPEESFTSDTVSLLAIPLEDDNRYTLRVYDASGRGGRVLVHVYAQLPFDNQRDNQETTPRKTISATLVPGGSAFETTTTALLPIHPATVQFNPIAGVDLTGIHRARIDIEPVDPGMRLWSFVSITNNRTHHVTTISQK